MTESGLQIPFFSFHHGKTLKLINNNLIIYRRQKMVQGQCLCGKVTVSVPKQVHDVSVCHCGMCRKWNGAPFMSVDCGSDVMLSGEEYITRYHSSEWGDRCFCRECGTHLFYYLKPADQYYVSAALLGETTESRLSMQIYTDSKPAYYNFAEKTPMLTEQDILAMFHAE
ncbi:TPA: GFA family protein [Morganella morganii]|uniref:GFA family protein n=1 Tax=Morganella morganii TaxID=582 RepID=UPI001BD91ED8|nr:GFA family protein [Morganella morganii]MBT0328603.1 GFA family protein [Morganella morganii subsp. morganii]HEG4391910.1 GFA family protein [Morganella morganii]